MKRWLSALVVGLSLYIPLLSYSFPSTAEIKLHTVVDVETIINVYNKAKAGDVGAQTDLGSGYISESIGNLPNYPKARYWFEKAAKQNSGLAHYFLYQIYMNGLGVEVDKKKALEHAKVAIPLMEARIKKEPAKSTLELWKLGHSYFWGVDGIVKQDFEKAFEYYQKSANQGDYHSILSLIFMYQHGIGVTENKQKAFEWANFLAKLGDPSDEYQAGMNYLVGEGTSKNVGAATKLLDKAAKAGYYPALYSLFSLAKYGDKTDLNIMKESIGERYLELQGKLATDPYYHGI